MASRLAALKNLKDLAMQTYDNTFRSLLEAGSTLKDAGKAALEAAQAITKTRLTIINKQYPESWNSNQYVADTANLKFVEMEVAAEQYFEGFMDHIADDRMRKEIATDIGGGYLNVVPSSDTTRSIADYIHKYNGGTFP